MELLKKTIKIFIMLLFFYSCGDSQTITQIIKVKVDTYISSVSNINNSDAKELSLSNNSYEERIVFKLPKHNESEDDFFDRCFDDVNLCSVYFIPITILVKVLTSCSDAILDPSNLTSAILVFNTNDGSTIAAGKLDLNLLSKPWWHTVNWQSAHPFSQTGRWNSLGGDIDSSVSFDTNCNNLSGGATCTGNEVKFEVTDYFKSLISDTKIKHFGMMISANTSLNTTKFDSSGAQSDLSPRVVATYTGSCISTLDSSIRSISKTKTFYLGTDISK